MARNRHIFLILGLFLSLLVSISVLLMIRSTDISSPEQNGAQIAVASAGSNVLVAKKNAADLEIKKEGEANLKGRQGYQQQEVKDSSDLKRSSQTDHTVFGEPLEDRILRFEHHPTFPLSAFISAPGSNFFNEKMEIPVKEDALLPILNEAFVKFADGSNMDGFYTDPDSDIFLDWSMDEIKLERENKVQFIRGKDIYYEKKFVLYLDGVVGDAQFDNSVYMEFFSTTPESREAPFFSKLNIYGPEDNERPILSAKISNQPVAVTADRLLNLYSDGAPRR